MRRTKQGANERLAAALAARYDGTPNYRRAVEELRLPSHFSQLQKVAAGDLRCNLPLAVALERAGVLPADEWPHLREPIRELLRLRGMAA